MKSSEGERSASMSIILLTIFIDILGIGIIIPVLPELVKEFVGGSTSLAARYVGIIGASYALMQFVCAPIMGALSDRFGRRPIIIASLVGLGIDFLIQGFAPSLMWLFVGRILSGAMGASITTANAYVADVSQPDNRARNFGLVGAMFGIGFTFGPALGGLLGSIDLRLPFFVAAGLAFANAGFGFFKLKESLPKENRSKFTLAKAHPLGTVGRLRVYPLVAGLAVAVMFTSFAQRGLENVWVLYGGERFDWSKQTNGLTLGLVGIMAIIVQGGMVRPVTRRFGERKTLVFGLIISAIAFMGYGLASEGWMVWLVIIFGSLGGLAGPAMQSLVAGSVEPSEQGKIQGALTSLMSLTSVFAPLFFATGLFSYFTSKSAFAYVPGAPLIVGSFLQVLALILVLRLFARIPADPTAPVPVTDSSEDLPQTAPES